MQAAIEAAKNNDPAVGYSVAFPFGLVGAILCMYFMQLVVKPNTEASSGLGFETVEVAVHSAEMVGRSVGQVMSILPSGVKILLVRAGGENKHPDPGLILGNGDVLMLAGSDRVSLDAAREMTGEHATGRITGDRSNIDYVRVFMSKSNLVGTRVSDLKLPVEATIMHVQRGDTAMLVTPDLTLELGDRVGLLTHRKAFQAVRKFFGNSIRGTTEFSYISLGIGMMLGVLLGIIPIPMPGLGTMKIGLAGGSLVAALVLGRLGRTWKLTWTMPLSANLTLRNFGLSMFLAQVGMSSGTPFVSVVQDSGVILLVVGALIVFALALTPLLIGHYVMRIPFDDMLGITSGVTGTPAILAYAYRSFPSDRVEICYAMIYPAATILKIVIAQVLIVVGSGG
jgi:putative transport protein